MGIAGISTPVGEVDHDRHRAGQGMGPRGEWDTMEVRPGVSREQQRAHEAGAEHVTRRKARGPGGREWRPFLPS